jgi:putative transposase
MDVPVSQEHPFPDTMVGLDVGIEYLVSTNDGLHVENPKVGKKHAKAVRVAQRALARCRRGSNRRRKVREKLARLQRAVARRRSDYLHQVSAALTRNYAFIAVEKLQVKNMTASAKGTVEEPGKNVRQKAGLNRSMLDASPSRLIDYLTYKAERAGGLLVKVNPHYTSQDCSSCGRRVKKSLSHRTHRCACGTILQRDHNAGRNILKRACEAHGRGMPPGDGNVRHWPERRLGNVVCEAA